MDWKQIEDIESVLIVYEEAIRDLQEQTMKAVREVLKD